MGKMTLDPNAQSYTDDEIVGKVNAAAVNITRVDAVEDPALKESADFQKITTVKETKLDGIEDGAKADQSGAEIKTAYEAEPNAFTDTKDTKLTGIEDGADVNPADLAALDAAQDTKLNGIEEGAEVSPTDDEVVGQINGAAVAITREAALSQADLKLVKSEPVVGEHVINFLVRKADGKLEADYNDTPES